MWRILFVDNDPRIVRALAISFAATQTWETAIAESGAAGIAALESASFDVVVTDLNMPDIDGREVLREARRLRPEALRVVLTGSERLAEDVDASLVIVKPCTAAEMNERIAFALATQADK